MVSVTRGPKRQLPAEPVLRPEHHGKQRAVHIIRHIGALEPCRLGPRRPIRAQAHLRDPDCGERAGRSDLSGQGVLLAHSARIVDTNHEWVIVFVVSLRE